MSRLMNWAMSSPLWLVTPNTRNSLANTPTWSSPKLARTSLQKKELPPQIRLAQEEEIQQLIARFQSQAPQASAVAELEVLVRTAVFKSANELVGWLLQQAVDRFDKAYLPKPGEIRKGRDTLKVQGIFGSFSLSRDYYYHPAKGPGHYPADDALGLEVSYTPALTKLLCLEGADEQTYLKAERHLIQTGGISVSARQVYLGCVFTQHRVDEKGRPVRDWESTTYFSSLNSIDHFGASLRQEALRRGMGSAAKVGLLIDGAHGLENMGKLNFKDGIPIVDFYHAMEHAGTLLVALLGKDHPEHKRRLRRWAKRLLKDKVQSLIEETRREGAGKSQASAVEEALHYFVSNVSRMQYGTFRAAGYFIGSGVVEAGCKTVIGSRCKQSGMFWSKPGAENILAFRCIHSSRRLEKFWKHRLNTKAANNH
jgi:hypothetical protein